MTKQVTLTIDDRPVTVPEGTLIVNAAKQAGIDIPVFCYHPKLHPVGMCRMCLVEIGRPQIDRTTGQPVLENGQPKVQFGPKLETSCSTPVSEGMVVRTTSDKAVAGQKEILEFLLTSHPLDCPICDKGGECPLQNLTMAHGPGKSRYLYDEKHHAEKRVPLGELIVLDRERCIQCARCIRFQDEVAGEPVLAFYQRGRATDIITNSDPPFDSVFSGNTSDICPVGALTTSDFRFGARPWELDAAASICTQCPVGCNTVLNTRREAASEGRIVVKRVMPRQNEQVNEIWLCDKGRFAHHFTESGHRLTRPLVRKNGELEPASWDEALGLVAGQLAASRSRALILSGGRLSNEDLFNLKSLADGLGGRMAHSSAMGGGEQVAAYGLSAGSNLGELGPGDAILVVASDLYEEAPVWWLRVKQAADRGATLVVANARGTRLEKFAGFVVRYSYGDEIATVAGLPAKEKIGAAIKDARNLVVFFGSDGLGLAGTASLAVACAELVKDRAGKPNNGLVGVWPHANDQGAWELGLRPLDDLQAAYDDAEVLYIAAADPVGDGTLKLKKGKFLVVQELFLTGTAKAADVVFPARAFAEREGTFTSGERRVQRFYAAVPAIGETKTDYAITSELGARLGVVLASSAGGVFARMAESAAAFAGLTLERLAETVPQWPAVGRSELYYGGTTYENAQGLGVQLGSGAAAHETGAGRGLRQEAVLRPKEDELLAVPVTKLYDQGLTVIPSGLLHERIGGLSVALHPAAAKQLGVAAGDRVKVKLDGHATRAALRLDDSIQAGVLLVPRSMGLAIQAPCAAQLEKEK
jgi:NADH-quinone oxidoreductase subunit G